MCSCEWKARPSFHKKLATRMLVCVSDGSCEPVCRTRVRADIGTRSCGVCFVHTILHTIYRTLCKRNFFVPYILLSKYISRSPVALPPFRRREQCLYETNPPRQVPKHYRVRKAQNARRCVDKYTHYACVNRSPRCSIPPLLWPAGKHTPDTKCPVL